MPSQIFWVDDEKTIIQHRFEGAITTEDYMHVIEKHYEMVSSVQQHTVDVIHERVNITARPRNIVFLLRYAQRRTPSNTGIRVMVNIENYFRMILDLARRITPQLTDKTYHANSVEAAKALIMEHRQKQNTPQH